MKTRYARLILNEINALISESERPTLLCKHITQILTRIHGYMLESTLMTQG
jgi:hypothetical protein